MAPHSSTLALKILWMEELGAGYCPWGRKELGTTERLHFLHFYPIPSVNLLHLQGKSLKICSHHYFVFNSAINYLFFLQSLLSF